MIPDWAEKPTSVPYANFGNPQSLNLYSYVQNNPATVGDPDGHACGGGATEAGQGTNCNQPKTDEQGSSVKSSDSAQNTVTVSSYQTTVTKNAGGEVTKVVTTTTSATFSTAKGHEGEFKSATSETRTITGNMETGPVKNETTGPKAISFGEAAHAMGADKMAQGVAAATGGYLAHFPHQVAQDFKQHPLKQVGIILGAASLPVGGVSVWGGVALGVAGAGAAIADDALHTEPYR